MGVVAAKPKGADACALGSGPGLGLVQQPERRAIQSLVGLIHMQGGRLLAVGHGGQHLDQTGHTGSGDQVPQIGFERANRHVCTPGKHPRHAAQLGRIANWRAGGVAFQQANIRRAQISLRVSQPQRALLAFFRRCQQPTATPVIGQAHTANHAQHVAASGQCVRQTLQHHKARSLGGHQPIGVAVKRAALAGFAQGRQGTKPNVDKQVIGLVHGTRHHQVGGAVVQAVTGQFDGVKRRGTSRVQRKRTATQAQRTGCQVRRQARVKTVLGVRAGHVAQPHTLCKLRHRHRGKRQIAQHQAGGVGRPLAPGAAQGITHALHGELKQRVKRTQFVGRHSQAGGLKPESADVAAHV